MQTSHSPETLADTAALEAAADHLVRGIPIVAKLIASVPSLEAARTAFPLAAMMLRNSVANDYQRIVDSGNDVATLGEMTAAHKIANSAGDILVAASRFMDAILLEDPTEAEFREQCELAAIGLHLAAVSTAALFEKFATNTTEH
jgi:hypothetical protein